MKINFVLNGKKYQMDVDPKQRLIDFLRGEMGLTGTKEGCGEGECGSCTVLMDRKAVHACLVLVAQIRDKEIMTVEGLSQNGELSKLQQSFIEHGAIQCGYCTPGMLMSATALLYENPHPSIEEIKIALAGNICRCSGYSAIIAAVKDAAEAREEGGLS